MTLRYVTVQQVRDVCGVDSSLVSDSEVESIMSDIEYGVERELNTTFTVREDIEILTGDYTRLPNIQIKNTPLLAIREIDNDGTTITISETVFERGGIVWLGTNASTSSWSKTLNSVKIRYLWGRLVESDTRTKINNSSGITAGTTKTIAVDSSTGFTANDYVWIIGMDGNKEVTKITNVPTSTSIVVDEISYDHEDNSIVILLKVPEQAKRLMKIIGGIGLVARVVGSTFDDKTGYTIGDLQIQKGEPYTQWRETADKLIKERDRILESFKITPYVTV